MGKNKTKARKLQVAASAPLFYELSQEQKQPEFQKKYKRRAAQESKNAIIYCKMDIFVVKFLQFSCLYLELSQHCNQRRGYVLRKNKLVWEFVMEICLICGNESLSPRCSHCGYDRSMDYESFGSLAAISMSLHSKRQISNLWKQTSPQILRCSVCGCESLLLTEAEPTLRCSRCYTSVPVFSKFASAMEEATTLREQLRTSVQENERLSSQVNRLKIQVLLMKQKLAEHATLVKKTEEPAAMQAFPQPLRRQTTLTGSAANMLHISGDGVVRWRSYRHNTDHSMVAVSIASYDMNFGILSEDGRVKTIGLMHAKHHGAELWRRIVSIAMGKQYIVGLTDNATVQFCGDALFGEDEAMNWKEIADISSGANFILGLTKSGTAVAAGRNQDGQCNVSEWKNLISIATGSFHSVGLCADGRVVSCGYNDDKQCDVNAWRSVVAISAGAKHTVGLLNNGTVIATGNNIAGQCNVETWSDIVAIQATVDGTVGWKKDGSIVFAGWASTLKTALGTDTIRKPTFIPAQ